jgi:hypothetical protein
MVIELMFVVQVSGFVFKWPLSELLLVHGGLIDHLGFIDGHSVVAQLICVCLTIFERPSQMVHSRLWFNQVNVFRFRNCNKQ